jgi:hypothetical protein
VIAVSERLPAACRMAVISLAMLFSSRLVMVSRRLTGVPAARLVDRSRMRRSPPEQQNPSQSQDPRTSRTAGEQRGAHTRNQLAKLLLQEPSRK